MPALSLHKNVSCKLALSSHFSIAMKVIHKLARFFIFGAEKVKACLFTPDVEIHM